MLGAAHFIDRFHNPFSARPVWPRSFLHPNDRHFIKTGHPETTGLEWSEFVDDRQSVRFGVLTVSAVARFRLPG